MFKIELVYDKELKEHRRISENKSYDFKIDNETSVIFDICNIFEETGIVKFVVSAFGQDEWPISCRFDLPEVIEILPEILMKIKMDDYNFKLDFCEQGIEREIIFKDIGKEVQIKCLSRTNWKPIPDIILNNKFELSKQFFNLFKTFKLLSNSLCPELLREPMFKKWLDNFNNIFKNNYKNEYIKINEK